MDDLDIAVLVPAAHDTNMGVLRVEYQIAGLGLGPGNGRAVAMLHPGPSAVAYDVAAAGHIVKYPVHKTGTIHAVGPVGPRGGAASGPNLLDGPPAGVPAKDQGLPAPKIIYLAHQLAGRLHHGPALRGQIIRQAAQECGGGLLGGAEVSKERVEGIQLLQQLRQGAVLVGVEAVGRPHFVCGLGRDGDVQNFLRPCLVLAVMLYRFYLSKIPLENI